MSVDTNTAVCPVGRSANADALFSAALILATVIPFFGIAATPAHPAIVPPHHDERRLAPRVAVAFFNRLLALYRQSRIPLPLPPLASPPAV